MPSPSPEQPRRAPLFVLAVAVAGAVGFFAWWWQVRLPVGKDDIAAFLDRTVAGGSLHFTVEEAARLRAGDGSVAMGIAATGRPAVPLYARVDAKEALRQTLGLSVPDSFTPTLLKPGTPQGAPFAFQGVVSARRNGTGWTLALLNGGFAGEGPEGKPRSSFGEPTYVLGEAGDLERLRKAALELQEASARQGRGTFGADSGRPGAVDGAVAPGRVFRGRAVETGEQQGTPLYLEIEAVSADGEVTALLRNEGSWHKARTFQGTLAADEATGTTTLSLTSQPDQAVGNAGPFLENTQPWAFALRSDAQGRLSEKNRTYDYQFQPMTPEQVLAAKARLEAEFAHASAAVEPGLLYHGTAVFKATGASEPVLLRFTRLAQGGQLVAAQLESTTRSWKRPLRGRILENTRRSGGEPVRLRSSAAEAVDDAAAGSVLGYKDDLEIQLGLDGSALAGEDAQFSYHFDPAGTDDLRKLEAARAERARAFENVFRSGIEFEGVMREEQGFIAQARLELGRVDPRTGAIAARITSLARAHVHRDFVGSCDPSGSSVILAATDNGSFDASGDFDVPFLIAPTAATLRLALEGSTISGTIEGNAQWTLAFAAGVFLSAPTESADPKAPDGGLAVFPALPTATGAYLLTRGGWSPLPKNNAHVFVEVTKADSAAEAPTNIADALAKGITMITKKREKVKTPYLVFDGKESLPESAGRSLVICLVGPDGGRNGTIELAPTDTLKEGQRRVQIAASAPSRITFGEQRVSTYIRRVAPGHVLITTTSGLGAGPYALSADGGYELRQD